MKWFNIEWWRYLFSGQWEGSRRSRPTWKVIICRAGEHKAGVWWYNSSGLEPDMHCKNCGEWLG